MADIINFPHINFQCDAESNLGEEHKFAEDMAIDTLSFILEKFARNGIAIFDKREEILPDTVLIIESIKSLYLKTQGKYHPLQEVSQEIFDSLEK